MEELTQNEKKIIDCWEQKSLRDVVREAASKGTYIALAVKYLMSKNGWNESTANEWFMSEVKAWTIQLLMRKQIFKVLHILNKVSINPEEHLMDIAESSPDIQYRDFIVEQIERISKDIKPENIDRWHLFKRHWNLLRYLEKSFEVDGTFKQNKVFGSGKELVVVTESEIKSLSIENIYKYSPEWKSKVAVALFFESFEFTLLDFTPPEEVWKYLLEKNKAMILVRWINIQTSEVVRDMNARYNFFNNESFAKKLLNVDTKGFQSEVLDKLDEKFRNWPITSDMITSVSSSNCFEYTKMCIYDTLCSYGIVNEDKHKMLCNIVSRLCRTQNLRLIDDIFMESCSTISKSAFYVELAKYCVKHKLFKALTICVDCNIVDKDLVEVEKETKDCIEMWILFKSIQQTSDRQIHVLPVYKTCEQIAKDNLDNYLSLNPHLLIGMILLDDSANLFDIFSEEKFLQFKDFELPNGGYQDKYPHLFDVYNKYANPLYDTKDVNVYQLLSDYRGLDVSKIFEFQLYNQNISKVNNERSDRRSLGSLLPDEMDVNSASIKILPQRLLDMPDFTNEKLMKRYGYVAKLNHIYFLKQYRPCNASQTFVAQQYQTYNRLQEKSIKSACCEAHALALQNWNDSAMSACAISFIAMIGCNPTRCRVHISAAKMIKQYLITHKNNSQEEANKTVNDYMSRLLQSSDSAAKDLLYLLEEITMAKVCEKQNATGKLDLITLLYESQTMVKFAMLHNLSLPEMQMKEFVKQNAWFSFLLFGDVFRYPLAQMLRLSQEFENKSYSEHFKYIMLHKVMDEPPDHKSQIKDNKLSSNNVQRRYSRLNSMESTNQSSALDNILNLSMGRDLWEVATACHGAEDPPAALMRAAEMYKEPMLVLIASCYEPNAVDILWVQWVLTSLGTSMREQHYDATHQLSTEHVQNVAELCLLKGYVTTLHESVLIFMPENPLLLLTSFLCRCIQQHIFDTESNKLLSGFLNQFQRRYSVVSTCMNWQWSKEATQKVAVALVKISLQHCFESAFHQREFLKCLATTQFGKGFLVPSPNFVTLYDILQISMETSDVLDVSKMLQEDSEQYLLQCIKNYTNSKNYRVAFKIAKLSDFPINDILKAEWTHKCKTLQSKDDLVEDNEWTLFVAQCSEAFKTAAVTFDEATEFLMQHVTHICDSVQKFYCYRIIMNWFEENFVYGSRREEIEHSMWQCYFQNESQSEIFLSSCQNTLNFIFNGQKDTNRMNKTGRADNDKPFYMSLSEIEIESDVGNIERVVVLEDLELIDTWRGALHKLLELKLLVEAFRLSALFDTSVEYRYRPPPCPVQIIRTCLKLAEGTCSPYELPQELRLVISSTLHQSNLSISGISEASFEELVIIQEKQEPGCLFDSTATGTGAQLAVREDADRLSALDALAARSGLGVAKQIASYYRIALQIGWTYSSVLKYQNNPVDFINFVSGRARMSLANLVFRTFNIPTKQVAEYLCFEMVAAVISPHLVKTSTFRQKEHFQYTLWGYTLNSDMEMFLNMRPDACIQIGRLVLDNLVAFRKMYKSNIGSKLPENTVDDSCLDVDTVLDEEYPDVDELRSATTDESTMFTADTDSVHSVSTVNTIGNKTNKDARRNLFDAVSKSNIHIRNEIKSNIRKITKGATLSTKQVNIISIELLVVAHECFSCACDTEGVAVVLRSAQALTSQLLSARSWRLMVRLLTGLARYTEMAYIFQALRDNHQFEFLLGQFHYMIGQQDEKINEFKHGLLDFLKNHCPGDTDTYIMVALHFNMYSEAANVKRKQALDLIKDLEKMANDTAKTSPKKSTPAAEWPMLYDNIATRSMLETALNECTDAAEMYLQGGCTGLAGEMAGLAQHIALQQSLLNASPTRLILNRSTKQKYELVSEYLSFMEGLVFLAPYSSEAWRTLAYRRAITNDQAFIRDMALYRPDVAHDFINRYKSEKNKTSMSQNAMTELRNLCK